MKKWLLHQKQNSDLKTQFESDLNLHPIVAQLLINRNLESVDEAKAFLNPSLDQIHDPWLMYQMPKAVDCVLSHLEQNHKIMVYGDYDVDGTTSVTMMFHFLSQFSDQICYYIPDRYAEGYGVSELGIEKAKSTDCQLIISLDCGIKAINQVQKARDFGIDFIICDHHQPGKEKPNATAILNPKQKEDAYPFKELSGCGVGFKLVQAIADRKSIDFESISCYLDLLAISIGADIVPMVGENRVLAHFGLQLLNRKPRLGLAPFIPKSMSNTSRDFDISDVVFKIAPRINAAGRIDHANKAVELLLEEDVFKAEAFAEEIDQFNENRKDLDQDITKDALKMLESDANDWTTVLCHHTWHKGVVGIVASRLIEQVYRPTIVLTEKDGLLTGSARSIPNFNMYEALEACSEHLIQFGGHYFAAGMTLKKEDFEAFKSAFELYAESKLKAEDLIESIKIESALELRDINQDLFQQLQALEPHGPQNLHPIFGAKEIRNTQWTKTVGQNSEHLSLVLADKQDRRQTKRGIAFRQGNLFEKLALADHFAIVYVIKENVWKDTKTLQLEVRDMKFS
ncbi:MAG: single-stranded-DNA-specific exonuclease RecJ [Flavobacteriales bacterium]